MDATHTEQLQYRAMQTTGRLHRTAELRAQAEAILLDAGVLLRQSAPLSIRGQVDALLRALRRPPTEHR